MKSRGFSHSSFRYFLIKVIQLNAHLALPHKFLLHFLNFTTLRYRIMLFSCTNLMHYMSGVALRSHIQSKARFLQMYNLLLLLGVYIETMGISFIELLHFLHIYVECRQYECSVQRWC